MDLPKNVLIVDDQQRARQSLSALLGTLAGVGSIREAENGLVALELVAESPPDVVVMDVRMPQLDGLQATRRIKELSPQTRVIILTLYPEYRDEAATAGADEFLIKGSSSQALSNALFGNSTTRLH